MFHIHFYMRNMHKKLSNLQTVIKNFAPDDREEKKKEGKKTKIKNYYPLAFLF